MKILRELIPLNNCSSTSYFTSIEIALKIKNSLERKQLTLSWEMPRILFKNGNNDYPLLQKSKPQGREFRWQSLKTGQKTSGSWAVIPTAWVRLIWEAAHLFSSKTAKKRRGTWKIWWKFREKELIGYRSKTIRMHYSSPPTICVFSRSSLQVIYYGHSAIRKSTWKDAQHFYTIGIWNLVIPQINFAS